MIIKRFLIDNQNNGSFEISSSESANPEDPSAGSAHEIIIELSPAEVRKAYEEYRLSCLYMDAENHFNEFYSDAEESTSSFSQKYGFLPEQALDASSQYYILEDVVDYFMNYTDCNIAENDLWQAAFSHVLG